MVLSLTLKSVGVFLQNKEMISYREIPYI